MNQNDFLNDIYDITMDKIDSIARRVIEDFIMKSDFLVSLFINELLKCLSYRSDKVNELANLIIKIGIYLTEEKQIQIKDKLKISFLSTAFRTYQNDINIEEKTYIMAFLYKLFEMSFYDDFSLIFDAFQKIFNNESESSSNFLFLFVIWFLPEIEEHHPVYLNNKLNELSHFVKSSDCSTLFFNIEANIKILRNDNCKVLKKLRENCYNYNFYVNKKKYLKNNNEIENEDENEKILEIIEPSIFCTCPFLQYRPAASMIDAFFQTHRFDLKKGQIDFTMIDDNDNHFTYFIAASGSIENIQYIQQKIQNNDNSRSLNLKGTLHIASLFHRNDLFQYLYDSLKGDDPQSILIERVWRLGTVLHQAAISDNIKTLEFFTSHGVDITLLTDDEGRSIIHHAAQFNSTQFLIEIENFFANSKGLSEPVNLENSSFKAFSSFVNSADDNGITPLMYAAMNNSIEVVQFFLRISRFYKLVIDVNSRDTTGKTALHYAAKTGATEIAIELLNFKGIAANSLDNSQRLPSHFASHYGHPSTLEALIVNGSSADRRSKNGWTPLKFAIACGHTKCVTVLLKYIQLSQDERDELLSFSQQREKYEISKLISK